VNANFIPVKVDREVNAGLDAALQGFPERTRGVAGWPLNVFLTPECHIPDDHKAFDGTARGWI